MSFKRELPPAEHELYKQLSFAEPLDYIHARRLQGRSDSSYRREHEPAEDWEYIHRRQLLVGMLHEKVNSSRKAFRNGGKRFGIWDVYAPMQDDVFTASLQSLRERGIIQLVQIGEIEDVSDACKHAIASLFYTTEEDCIAVLLQELSRK